MKSHFRQPRVAGALLTLSRGDYRLVLAPAFGARIVAFTHGGRDILRPAPAPALAAPKVYEFAGFPLMPYSGPIFGGGFDFAGSFHPLGRNVAEEPTATHGEGWIMAWRIVSHSEDRALLRLDYAPEAGSFPFAWQGELGFGLTEDAGLAIDLKLTCRDHRPMPAGIGLHPYFPKPPGTRLKFFASGVWPPDAPEAVTLGCQPLEPGLDFRDGPDISAIVLDRCFEGWDGRAEVIWPDGPSAVIEADGALTRLQIYDAWDYPYICVEPVSNANDGFNRMARGVAGHGVTLLEPGRSLGGQIRIALR
jgi:aldose 1-epimerase